MDNVYKPYLNNLLNNLAITINDLIMTIMSLLEIKPTFETTLLTS